MLNDLIFIVIISSEETSPCFLSGRTVVALGSVVSTAGTAATPLEAVATVSAFVCVTTVSTLVRIPSAAPSVGILVPIKAATTSAAVVVAGELVEAVAVTVVTTCIVIIEVPSEAFPLLLEGATV